MESKRGKEVATVLAPDAATSAPPTADMASQLGHNRQQEGEGVKWRRRWRRQQQQQQQVAAATLQQHWQEETNETGVPKSQDLRLRRLRERARSLRDRERDLAMWLPLLSQSVARKSYARRQARSKAMDDYIIRPLMPTLDHFRLIGKSVLACDMCSTCHQ